MVLYLSSASYLPFSELNYGSPSLRKMELMLQKKMRSTVQTLSSEAPGEEVDSYRGWLLATGSIMKQKSAGRCTPEPLPFQLVISCVLALPAPMAPPRRMTLNGELPCDLN